MKSIVVVVVMYAVVGMAKVKWTSLIKNRKKLTRFRCFRTGFVPGTAKGHARIFAGWMQRKGGRHRCRCRRPTCPRDANHERSEMHDCLRCWNYRDSERWKSRHWRFDQSRQNGPWSRRKGNSNPQRNLWWMFTHHRRRPLWNGTEFDGMRAQLNGQARYRSKGNVLNANDMNLQIHTDLIKCLLHFRLNKNSSKTGMELFFSSHIWIQLTQNSCRIDLNKCVSVCKYSPAFARHWLRALCTFLKWHLNDWLFYQPNRDCTMPYIAYQSFQRTHYPRLSALQHTPRAFRRTYWHTLSRLCNFASPCIGQKSTIMRTTPDPTRVS